MKFPSNLQNLPADKERWAFIFLMMTTSFFAFYNLGAFPLFEWDESRYGAIAVHMVAADQFLPYYFEGKPILSKPPLGIWLIALSFKIFGFNEWALRLPSALAIIGSVMVFYLIVRRYYSWQWTLFLSMVLVSVRGWIGVHVGRTGDLDALLVLFLMISTFFYLRWAEDHKKGSIQLAMLFLGLAYFTKGPAAFVLLPGWVIYYFMLKKNQEVPPVKSLLRSAPIFLAFPLLWLYLTDVYFSLDEDVVPGKYLWVSNVWERFTKMGFHGQEYDPFFIFHYLDSKFNVWNYLLYILLGLTLFHLIKRNPRPALKISGPSIQLFSLASWLPLAFILTIAATKHYWYLAPALPWMVVGFGGLIRKNFYRSPAVFTLVLGLALLYKMGHKTFQFSHPGEYPKYLREAKGELKNAEKALFFHSPPWNHLLFVQFRVNKVYSTESIEVIQRKLSPQTVVWAWQNDKKEVQSLMSHPVLISENSSYFIMK